MSWIDKSRIQVLERAALLLQHMAAWDGAGVTELSQATGLAVTTVHRLLRSMQRLGMVEQDARDGRYRPGLRLFEWGQAAVLHRRVREAAKPVMLHLAAEVGYTAVIAVLDGADLVYLDWIPAQHIIQAGVRIGDRFPAHCSAMGRAMLAALPPTQAEALLRRARLEKLAPGSPTSLEEVLAILATARENGYATDDEARRQGFRSVGAAVRGPGGEVVAGIGVGGPVSRLPREMFPTLGARLVECAATVSTHLGYAPRPLSTVALPRN